MLNDNTDIQGALPPSFSLSVLPSPYLLKVSSWGGKQQKKVLGCYPGGTYYVESTNSTMFPPFCLPGGLSLIWEAGVNIGKEGKKLLSSQNSCYMQSTSLISDDMCKRKSKDLLNKL